MEEATSTTQEAGAGASTAATTASTSNPSSATSAVSTSLRSQTGGDSDAVPAVSGNGGTCPLPGIGLPSFVSQCYCGFITGPEADGCGPDDGTACWCRCCCHYRSGTCRYSMVEAQFSSSMSSSLQKWLMGLTLLLFL